MLLSRCKYNFQVQMSPGTCADLRVFSGTKRQSGSNSPHYSSLAHTHPAALPSLPCLPICLFSQADTDSLSSRQEVQQGNTRRLGSTQSPHSQRAPGLAVKCKLKSWHQAIYCYGHPVYMLWKGPTHMTQRSSSYFQLLASASWNLKSALPAEEV